MRMKIGSIQGITLNRSRKYLCLKLHQVQLTVVSLNSRTALKPLWTPISTLPIWVRNSYEDHKEAQVNYFSSRETRGNNPTTQSQKNFDGTANAWRNKPGLFWKQTRTFTDSQGELVSSYISSQHERLPGI